ELLVNFKGYETLSRNNGVDPKGLIHALDFINDVLELEPTAEACVNALSGLELTKLQNSLRKVVLQEDDTALPLENGKTTPLEKGEVKQEVAGSKKKKLKMTPSDVSMDSHGFPAMLKSPKEDKANEGTGAGPSRLLKKRVGQAQQIAEVEADPGLRSKLGLERKKMSRPAAVKEKKTATASLKRPATFATGTKKETTISPLEGPGPWVKLQKVTGSRPERSYVLGSKVATLPPKPIVEVTQKMSKKYSWVLDRIIDSLGKENLSKEEARELRAKLCKQYP
ncbi:Uncharacterized protein SCF082_LOCUS5119, partial [Durusdinium trenchii]